MTTFLKSKKPQLVLFLLSMAISSSLLVGNLRVISPDGTGYHSLAVNIAKGHGLSKVEQAPFVQSFFREPGYPYFLGGIYSLVNLFTDIDYIHDNYANQKLTKIYPEIVAAKIIQCILGSVAILLLYSIFSRLTTRKIAFFSCVSTALFFNLAFYYTFILREALVFFLLVLANWFFIKQLKERKKLLYDLALGLTVGLLILVFQVHVVIVPVLFFVYLYHFKDLKKSFFKTFRVGLIALLTLIPHLIAVYQFYPDVRIVKSVGCSLTHEMGTLTRAQNIAKYYDVISGDECSKMRVWNDPSKEQFERSFNGYYVAQADSINRLISEPVFSKRKVLGLQKAFLKSFFLTKLGLVSGKLLLKKNLLYLFSLLLFPVFIGLLGLIGGITVGRKFIPFFFPFVVYSLLFFLLGSEYRRMIIIQPYLLFFVVVLIFYLLDRWKKHRLDIISK